MRVGLVQGQRRTLRRALVALLSVGLAGAGSSPGLAGTMSLPGSFAVSPTGGATYSIPIALPPGTAGMTPTLSLEYSSQGANGLLGMGWSLSGLPSIGRCGRTVAQDGVSSGVNFDTNDRFCLDGQRLVATSGAYSADGTQYRTEVESFSKVISHGTRAMALPGLRWARSRARSWSSATRRIHASWRKVQQDDDQHPPQ